MQKGMVRFTIDIPEKKHAFLKIVAANEGVSMRKLILSALDDKVGNQEMQAVYINHPEFENCKEILFKLCEEPLKWLSDQ